MMVRKLFIELLVGSSGVAIATVAQAQEAAVPEETPVPENQLEEIVVTAEKRANNIQDIPIAVTAMSGEDLASRGIGDIEALAPSLPNVNFGRNLGFARIAIRGVGLDTVVAGQ